MNAAVFKIKMHMPQSQSLKDKRRILQSMLKRLRNQYNISIAEVDDQDLWQMATIGLSCVCNSHGHAGEIVDSMLNFIRQNYPEVEVVNHESEILQGF